MFYKTNFLSPIGKLYIFSTENELLGLQIENQRHFLSNLNLEAKVNPKLPILIKTKHWLEEYFKGKKPDNSLLNLAPKGTEFEKEIWEILCEIPYGKTISYKEIAQKIALKKGMTKMSAQAVGRAVGCNPILIIIPCHRVLGSKGDLVGYAGGIDIKKRLLEFEGKILESYNSTARYKLESDRAILESGIKNPVKII